MAIKVYPYKQGSASAKALADALGGRVLKREGSKYRRKPGDFIINWGATAHPIGQPMLNWFNVDAAANKLHAFQWMKLSEVSIPEFWTDKDEIPDDQFPVVCRTVLNGHSGAGIVMAADRGTLVDATLYVKYIKKSEEYRVHVVREEVIAVQRKARRLDAVDVNWQIRNHANGFVFARDGFETPQMVLEEAIKAVAALGLDFGAVDIVWNNRQEKAFVLECNTAPGLEGATVDDYANAFRRLFAGDVPAA